VGRDLPPSTVDFITEPDYIFALPRMVVVSRQNCRPRDRGVVCPLLEGKQLVDMEITHEKSSHGRLRGHNPSCIVERVDGVIAVDNALSVK